MNNDIKVRTSEAHKVHITQTTLPGGGCGCATRGNVGPGIEITRCPCGCAYLTEHILKTVPFTCYDCKRSVHA